MTTTRDTRLDPAVLAAGEWALSHYDSDSIAWIGGSFVEGFANGASDVDLFVVVNRPSDLPADVDGTFNIGSSRADIYESDEHGAVDVEVWNRADVDTLLEQLSVLDLRVWADTAPLSDAAMRLLHRMRTGVCLGGQEQHAAWVRDTPWTNLAAMLAGRALQSYNGWAQDAGGAIGARDAGTAMLMSREAMERAVDAYIAARGETNGQAKWRFRLLERLGEDQVLEEFLRLELDASAEPDDLLAVAKKRLRFAAKLSQTALRLIDEQVATAGAEPAR